MTVSLALLGSACGGSAPVPPPAANGVPKTGGPPAPRPKDPPIGVSIETLGTNPTGAVVIDGQPVKDTYNRDGICVVVINRANRVVELSGETPRDSGGLKHLADIVKQYSGTDGYLIVLSSAKGVAPSAIDQFNPLAKSVGASEFSKDQLGKISGGAPFSIVGVPGGAADAAWTNVALKNDGSNGNITGYLQYIARDRLYGFVNTDTPTFEMSKPSQPDRENTITWAGKTYPSQLRPNDTAGFEMLFADSLTGKVFWGLTLGTNCSACDQAFRQQAFANGLQYGMSMDTPSGRPPLVLLQSIGKPVPAGPGWSAAGDLVAKLGGNRLAFMQLDGKSEYALVGSETSGGAVAEASDVAGVPGPLVGVLSRAHSYSLQPVVGGPELGVNTQLVEITNQPATPFPAFTPGEQKAEVHIGRKLKLCPNTGDCSVRNAYYLAYQDDWGILLTQLGKLPYPGLGSGFGKEDFEAVKRQLEPEFAAVGRVKNYFASLQAPFLTATGGDRLDLQAIGEAIYKAIQPPPVEADHKTPYVLGLLSKIAALGQFAGPPESAVAAGVSASFALGAYLMQPDGSQVLPPDIRVNASRLISEYKDGLLTAAANITHTALINVSDYGKLMAIYNHLRDPLWDLPQDPAEAVAAMALASKQWLAERLIPLAYPRGFWSQPPPPNHASLTGANAMRCGVTVGYDEYPWSEQPANAQVRVLNSWDAKGKVMAVYWFSRLLEYPPYDRPTPWPKPEIANMLFNPVNPRTGSLGINPLSFYTPQVFGKLTRALNGTRRCAVG